ncbi:hypothetical protein BTHI11S_02121 [Bosea thiooxidans]
MVTRVATVAFEGVEARAVDVQVQVAAGGVAFILVGLPDKAVAESRERVRAALLASGLALPAKRITINLAPADLPKEGSHYDLPIALAVMAAIGAIPPDALAGYVVLGELGLDGTIAAVAGVLPAAIAAYARGQGLICPAASGPEAAWAAADIDILAPRSLIQLANHFKGTQVMARPEPAVARQAGTLPDLADVKGQESGRRALEIAAAGGHNLLMNGPPGAGKSMLASRLPSILPPLSPRELLEVSMVLSVAGHLADGALTDRRPFRAPHHSASMAALVGGGLQARPGEVSLAHHGVLFLDELPEFQPQVLDALRQPMETGDVLISRANHRVSYPARFQLVAAINPCRCGKATEPGFACPAPAERALHGAVPGQAVRPAARSGRHRDRSAGRDGGRSDPARGGGELGRGGRAGGRGTAAPERPLRGARPRRARARACRHQCRLPGACARGDRASRQCRARIAARCRRGDAPDGASLSPDPEGRPHPRRSRRGGRVGRLHLAEALSYRSRGEPFVQAA